MLVLHYNSFFVFFQFSWEAVQSTQVLCWIIFLRWDGEVHVVCDAHLFLLQFHAGSFVVSWWGEMALLISVQCGVGRLSLGWGSRMLWGLILIDALSSAYWEKKEKKRKKKEREVAGGFFSSAGWTCLAVCARWGFHGC
jgi:hypothetical protein